MMTAKEIAAILIAFDEGKRVVRSLNVRGIRDNEQVADIVWLIAEIAEGAHFEIAREPMVIWLPTFLNKPFTEWDCKESVDKNYAYHIGYTGALQFKQVIEP